MKQISFFINVIAFIFATVTGVQAQVIYKKTGRKA